MNINDFNTDKLYQSLGFEKLNEIAQWAGLTECIDIEAIKPWLKNKSEILDIGCGYGRVLPWLLNNTNAHITAIEKAYALYTEASSIHNKRLSVIYGNILNHSFTKKFDCIMMLWTGITDYSKAEANLLFDKIKSILTKDGIVCFDYINAMPKNASISDLEEHLFCVNGIGNAEGYAYRPPFDLIQSTLESKGFVYNTKVNYQTTQSDKVIYLFNLKE